MKNPIREFYLGNILVLTTSDDDDEIMKKLLHKYMIPATGYARELFPDNIEPSWYAPSPSSKLHKNYDIYRFDGDCKRSHFNEEAEVLSGAEFGQRCMDFMKVIKKGVLIKNVNMTDEEKQMWGGEVFSIGRDPDDFEIIDIDTEVLVPIKPVNKPQRVLPCIDLWKMELIE